MLAWLTPEDPAGALICFRVACPSGDEWEAALRGALVPLADSANWELHGAQTPEDTAQAFQDALAITVEWKRCMPIGSIIPYGGASAPAGWLTADGSEVSQADYPDLYALFGTVFGSASSGMFKLPDLRGRMAIGTGTGSGLSQRDLADTGGYEQITLTEDQMPSHTHSEHNHGIPSLSGELPQPVTTPSIIGGSTGSTGGDDPHDNMPPFLALTYIILAK